MRVHSPKRRTNSEFPSSNPLPRSQSDPRATMPHHRAITAADTGSSRPVSPFRKQRSQAVPASRQDISISRTTSVPSGGGGMGGGGSALTPTSGRNKSSRPWWGPGSPRQRPVLQQGLLKKRGGRINTWAERYFILRDDVLEQYPKGEDGGSSEPKHFYDLDPSCSLSEIKEAKAGGRPLFYFALEWPPLSQCKEEGDGDSGRSGQEGYEPDMSGPSNVPTPLDSPTEAPNKVSAGLDFGSEDGTMPLGPPRMERVDSVSSLTGTGHQGRRFRRPRCNSSNGGVASVTASPLVAGRTRESPGGGEEGDEMKRNETLACQKRNETIESMMAAQRDNETRMARRKLEEVEQFLGRVAHPLASRQRLTGYERGDKARRPEKKKRDGRVINTRSQAVAATAVGVSWLTAGIATGGLVIAGTLVAAGVTVGSMGVYNKYKSHKNPNGSPGRVRLASDKVETAEQWRNAILEQLALLRSQPRRELERSVSMGQGLGLGIPWVTPPEGPPPALREIDLRAVDKLLSNATWASRGVMHGLPILQQEVGMCAVEGDGDGFPGEGEACDAGGATTGWGLGGAGPVLKTQTIVRASPLETFVALIGAPKHSMTAVMSGTFTVEALDDHSDVIRWCLRPAWLKLAWASPRDFCLARYWHMAEDGCYIVTFASMVHPDCPVDPSFVRGEAHAVYTIAPRRDSVPGGHASPECLLTCHVQVDPKGWVWNRLGFRERYASHLLMTALEVRDVIEAERFMTPRINLRPDSTTGGDDDDDRFGGGSAGPRCGADGKQLLFGSGLAAVGGDSRGVGSSMESACHALAMKNLTPLENCLPSTLDPRRWTEADGTDFMVRGASYLSTRVKVPSAKQMFRLRAVDLFLLPAPATHLAIHPRNRVQLAREAGESTFVWVLQIMVPGPPHYSFVCYFTPGADNWLDQETPFGRLAKRVFFGDSDAFRDERLKLIPKIVEGNWVVKRAAGTTPAILGTKLKQHHFRGDNYLETDLEIASSSLAANITRLCTGYAKALVVDMVWTIQGNTEEELPEVALGGVRINHLDLITAQPLDPLAPA